MRALLLMLLSAALGFASTPLDPLENPGFVHFYNLEYDQALADFGRQAAAHPDDPVVYTDIAQTILYHEMYRDGALESQLVSGNNPFLRRPKMEISSSDKAQFNDAIGRAVKLSEQQLARTSKDVHALNVIAVAHGLRANYLFLVEKSWMAALHEAIAGRKANDEILQIDPGFVDAHLLRGVSEYTVGCMPGYLRALGAVNGFHGDKEDGIRQLQFVANSGTANRYDASILLAAIYRRERRPQQAIPLLEKLAATFPRNYILRLEQVQMYSDSGDKAAALRILAELEQLHERGAAGYARLSREKILYSRGNLLFWYGDLDQALPDLRRVTTRAGDLDLSTAVMAWLRLGQVYDLKGDRRNAEQAYQETVRTAPNSEAAAEAKGYISKPYRRKHLSG